MMSESVFSSTGKGHGEMKASELATRTNFILLIMYIFYLSSCFVTSLYCVCVYFWDMSNSFIVRQAKILKRNGKWAAQHFEAPVPHWQHQQMNWDEEWSKWAAAHPRIRSSPTAFLIQRREHFPAEPGWASDSFPTLHKPTDSSGMACERKAIWNPWWIPSGSVV